jgi:hypothetical protein
LELPLLAARVWNIRGVVLIGAVVLAIVSPPLRLHRSTKIDKPIVSVAAVGTDKAIELRMQQP